MGLPSKNAKLPWGEKQNRKKYTKIHKFSEFPKTQKMLQAFEFPPPSPRALLDLASAHDLATYDKLSGGGGSGPHFTP